MEARGKRILLTCGAGCAVVLLAAIGSCVAFTVWINSPGELLESGLMLDEDAVGYAEWRLDLEDPGTEAIVMALIDAINRQSDVVEAPGVVRWLLEYNQRRQEKQMRKFFPATAVWTLYPDGADDELNVYSLSVKRLGHQVVLADWILGWFLGRSDLPAVEYRGEKILSFEEEDSDGEDSGWSFNGFLNSRGLFFSDDLEGAKKAVDRLLDGGAALEAADRSGAVTDLEALYRQLDASRPLRGALSSRRGELERLVSRWLDEEDPLDPELAEALRSVDAMTFSGGALGQGDLALYLDFLTRADIEMPIRRVVESLREAWAEDGTPIEAEVRRHANGVQVSLRIRDAAGLIEEWSLPRLMREVDL